MKLRAWLAAWWQTILVFTPQCLLYPGEKYLQHRLGPIRRYGACYFSKICICG